MVASRWSAALPFVGFGTMCVVAGGLVSAVTALAPSEHGAWAAAYLVLVGGVAQVALGAGQAQLAPRIPPRKLLIAELVAWNLGNAAVLSGELSGVIPLVYAGGAVLVAALTLLVRGMRGTAARVPWMLHAFRALVLLLLVSIPVGLVLAELRPA